MPRARLPWEPDPAHRRYSAEEAAELLAGAKNLREQSARLQSTDPARSARLWQDAERQEQDVAWYGPE